MLGVDTKDADDEPSCEDRLCFFLLLAMLVDSFVVASDALDLTEEEEEEEDEDGICHGKQVAIGSLTTFRWK